LATVDLPGVEEPTTGLAGLTFFFFFGFRVPTFDEESGGCVVSSCCRLQQSRLLAKGRVQAQWRRELNWARVHSSLLVKPVERDWPHNRTINERIAYKQWRWVFKVGQATILDLAFGRTWQW